MKVGNKLIIGLLVFAVIIILISSIVFALSIAKIDDTEFQWVSYIVNPGDTFWSIMPDTDKYDIRYLIKVTKAHNRTSDLIAYDMIEIPIINN